MQSPIVTWPGGIGNPIGEKIVTSGGKRSGSKRKTRRNRNRKQTRKNRSCRRNRGGCTRRNRRS